MGGGGKERKEDGGGWVSEGVALALASLRAGFAQGKDDPIR